MLKKLVVGSMLLGSTLVADSVSININSDSLELGGEINLNKIYMLNENSDYLFTASYLKGEENNVDSNLLSVGVKALNPYLNDNGVSFGLGIKMVRPDFDGVSEDFFAIPLGLFANYQVNEDVHIDGSFDYAPNVLSMQDAEKFQAWNIKANYEVIDNGFAYVGLRNIKAEYEKIGEVEFDDSLYFGYKVHF